MTKTTSTLDDLLELSKKNELPKKKSQKVKIREKYEAKRNQHWPSLASIDPHSTRVLWESNRKTGFANIPRAMPLILNMMNYLATKPVSDTYFALWCRDFGTGFFEINDLDSLALEAGFSGSRATGTLNARLRILSNETDDGLGFIRAKRSSNGKYKAILILNPMLVIYLMHQEGRILQSHYDELFSRCSDVGDKDLDKFKDFDVPGYKELLKSIS